MSKKTLTSRVLDFLNSIRGEYIHPMVVTYGINGCGQKDVSEDTVRWALERLEKMGKIKRRQQYGIRGKIGYHYAGLERKDIEKE